MLLVMLGPVPVPATMPDVTNGIVAVVVMGVVVAGSVAAGPALPTGYKPMLWPFSPSGPLEETVVVPVVPDPGDGCQEDCVDIEGSAPGGKDLLMAWQQDLPLPDTSLQQDGGLVQTCRPTTPVDVAGNSTAEARTLGLSSGDMENPSL